jgi:hypothetical protein
VRNHIGMSTEHYLDQVRKSVTFIFVPQGNQQPQPHGTGFFASVS